MSQLGKTLIFTGTTLLLALGMFPVAAQVTPLGGNVNCTPGVPCGGGETLAANLVQYLVNIILAVALLLETVTLIFFIYAAFKYIASRGDIEAAAQAKRQMVFALMGLVLIAGGAFMAQVIVIGLVLRNFLFLRREIETVYIPLFAGLLATIAAVYIILAGVKYINSHGDLESAGAAKRQLIYAIVGLIIAGLVFVIRDAVVNLNTVPLLIVARNIINVALSLVSIGTAVYLIVAGVMYIMSSGDSDRAQRAKQQVIYALVGLIIIALAAAIVNFIIAALP